MTDVAIPELTVDEARALTDEIRQDAAEIKANFVPKVKRAFFGRADRVLGYESWDAYRTDVLGDVRIPVGERQELAGELANVGMSARAIGSALGVSHPTVLKDLRSTGNSLPVDRPAKVVSLDGRKRPSTQPVRHPEPPGTDAEAPTKEPLTAADEMERHAEMDAQLDAEMEGTATRFRRNFSTVLARSDDVWQFDPERVAEVYAAEFDQAIRPFLQEMNRWCEQVSTAHRRRSSGLRVVSGGSR